MGSLNVGFYLLVGIGKIAFLQRRDYSQLLVLAYHTINIIGHVSHPYRTNFLEEKKELPVFHQQREAGIS